MSINITSNSTADEEFTGLSEGVLWSGAGMSGILLIWYIYCKIQGCIARKEERGLELWLQTRHKPPDVKENSKPKPKSNSCCNRK
mgnify:CR=1 FL=1